MRVVHKLWIGLGSLLSVGACSNAAPPVAGTGTPAVMTPGGTAGKPATGTAGGTVTSTTAGNAALAGASAAAGKAGATAATAGSPGAAAGGTSAGVAGGAPVAGGTAPATAGSGPATATAGYRECPGKMSLEGECKASGPGVYAMRVDIDVWWRDENNSPTIYDPGRGTISVFFRTEVSNLCQDGSDGSAVVKACGDIIPPLLADANCGVIQIVFPDEMWDAPNMPLFKTTGTTTGFNVNDTLTVVKVAGLVGIDLPSSDAPWPTFMQSTTFACPGGTGEKCYPDHDGDGHPGITVKLKQDGAVPKQLYECAIAPWEYMTAPLSALGALDKGAGADETYIGLRTKIGGSGKIAAGCMSGAGSSDADGFESRLYGCKLKSGGPCDDTGALFVDTNLPQFHVLQATQVPPAEWKHVRPEVDSLLNRTPSQGPKSSVVRMGDLGANVTCDQVRKAMYP